jgi:hypothetical protein
MAGTIQAKPPFMRVELAYSNERCSEQDKYGADDLRC